MLMAVTRNTGFAQYGLRNAGQLVRFDPSLGMAEFISNSAILQAIRHQSRAHGSDLPCPGRESWQTSPASLPSLDLAHRVRMTRVERRMRERWQIVNDLWETNKRDVNQLSTTAC